MTAHFGDGRGARLQLALVRHGDTPATEAVQVCGRSDPPLSAAGHAAVARLARSGSWRRTVATSDELWCSPLRRTCETAAGLDLPTVLGPARIDPRLVELDFGDWEGLGWDEVHRRWPNELARWGEDWIERAPPGGESFAALVGRARSWYQTWRQNGRSSIVVTHGGCVRALLCLALERPLGQAMRVRVDPASLHVLLLDPRRGPARLRHANHLG